MVIDGRTELPKGVGSWVELCEPKTLGTEGSKLAATWGHSKRWSQARERFSRFLKCLQHLSTFEHVGYLCLWVCLAVALCAWVCGGGVGEAYTQIFSIRKTADQEVWPKMLQWKLIVGQANSTFYVHFFWWLLRLRGSGWCESHVLDPMTFMQKWWGQSLCESFGFGVKRSTACGCFSGWSSAKFS